MSQHPRDRRQSEPHLERLVEVALSEMGELIPNTEEEVARMEAELGALPDAPPRLAGLSERRQVRTRSWMTHASAAALGAMAASFLLFWLRPSPPRPVVFSPGAEHSAAGTSTESPGSRLDRRLSLPAACRDCCAGRDCAAKPSTCPSGRPCVPCSMEGQSRYRIRLGAVLFENTAKGTSLAQEGLQLCMTVAQGKPSCVPASHYSEASEPWRVLPPTLSAQDLLAGVTFELKSPSAATSVATWKRPVAAGADILCRGLSVAFVDEKEERIGLVSAFLDDAQFVEVRRAATPAPLVELAGALSSPTARALVYETSATGDRRFALVVGPIGVAAANHVRWQLLDRGYAPSFTTGSDLVPPARPTETP